MGGGGKSDQNKRTVGITDMHLQKQCLTHLAIWPDASINYGRIIVAIFARHLPQIRDNLYLEIHDFIHCGYRMKWLFTNLPSVR
jgi:hypothetical protein